MMKIGIASGKGGTGKTTVATNLALEASQSGKRTAYLDCDVEEPNGHIFLKPKMTSKKPVGIRVPKVDENKCIHCGKCAKVCRYSAIVCIKDTIVTNPSMCHGCGGCSLVCPSQAITEEDWEIGIVERGKSEEIDFIRGELKVGVAMSPPLIRAVKDLCPAVDMAIFDSPPGTSCPVITTLRGVDFVLLVTEPTPFGLHDLTLAADMVREIGIPFGVVVNRVGIGDDRVHVYCTGHNIPILLEIPDDRRIAEAYSRGKMLVDSLSEYRGIFLGLIEKIQSLKNTGRNGSEVERA